MSTAPPTDWDLIYRWEWFRRARWQSGFRQAKLASGGGSARAFYDLAQLVGVKVALDCSCGLGLKTICLAEMGLNVVGADGSEVAVTRARELAQQEGVSLSFFRSQWEDLPANMPHAFDAILNDALSWMPEWEALKRALGGCFYALRPGGFLMFGAGQDDPPDNGSRLLDEEWEREPAETLDWLHREGKVTCVRIRQRTRATDYIDERILFAIDDGGDTRMEATVLRQPFYWNREHWRELIYGAGFCHLETRTYEGCRADGGRIQVNVAWKTKSDEPPVDVAGRNAPYEL